MHRMSKIPKRAQQPNSVAETIRPPNVRGRGREYPIPPPVPTAKTTPSYDFVRNPITSYRLGKSYCLAPLFVNLICMCKTRRFQRPPRETPCVNRHHTMPTLPTARTTSPTLRNMGLLPSPPCVLAALQFLVQFCRVPPNTQAKPPPVRSLKR